MRILIFLLLLPIYIQAQEIAFPGAEGFGKYATGGRDGKILIVSNLNDSGPGSLREALNQEYPRIIVFKVSGTIKLESELDIKYGDVSILGHSAPGEGITVKNYPIEVKGVENIIIRYIRSRLGDKSGYQGDAISAMRSKNLIIDHCSFSWATDESATFYDNENSTVQYCIISESLNNSVHEKGEHGYGGIWGGKGASFHHNLFAHHKSRNPRFNGERTMPEKHEVVDYRNNVIYNWRANSAYAGEKGFYNLVNNYYKYGPATEDDKRQCIIDPWEPFGKFYVTGNFVYGFADVTQNNRLGVFTEYPEKVLIEEPYSVVRITEYSAKEAFEQVLAESGASFRRDVIDKRIIKEVETATATYGEQQDGIIDSQDDVGGWPELKSGKALKDSDDDGMADDWEKMNGLNPADSSDASKRTVNEEYSNIEVFLNSRLK